MKKIKDFLIKHERHIGPAALILGFVWDSLTLGKPDQLYGHIVFLVYIFISGFGIVFLALNERKGRVAPTLLLALIQFSFGNLAGGLLVFYGQSGSFEGSLLFYLLFGAFIIGNEFVRNYYERLNFHVSAWFFLVFSYFSLALPIVFGKIGTFMFLISGLTSLLTAALLLYFIYLISPQRILSSIRKTIISIGSIFAIFNFLYFSNIFPPVPLSLTHIGIYHSIQKMDDGNFTAVHEKPKWYDIFDKTSDIFTKTTDTKAYCFSSVYTPVKITTEVNHRWEYYNENAGEWETKSLLTYGVIGGRYDGYRLYSTKSALTPGKWRCSVETARGALIGRITFDVVVGTPKNLITTKI